MPYRKKRFRSQRSFKKRAPKRRRRGSYRSKRLALNVIRGPAYMPDRILNRHKFITQTTLTYTGNINNSITVRANGLFDPIASIGHAALGFLQMTGIYELYNVLSCKARVTFTNGSTEPVLVVLLPYKDTLPAGMTADDIAANPYSVWRYLAPMGSGKDTQTLTKFMSSKKMFGRSWLQTNNMWGTTTTNPSELWYFNVRATYPQNVTTTLHMNIELDFYVQWAQRQVLDQDQ